MKILVAIVIAWMSVLSAQAQFSVSGKVTDQTNGEPLAGATVLEVNSQNGTITDSQGMFELALKNSDSKLQISYLGYLTKTIEPDRNFLGVALNSDYQLEEIIIETVRAKDEPVAYSTVPKKEIEKVYHGEQPIFFLEELTPSIFSYSESGTRLANYGNMRLRGIGQERINMTLNGIPLNDMIDHGVFFSNFTDIGNSIESVQVQRGVGTSSNGVASYAGSINFESVNLSNLKPEAALEVGIGSFNSRRFNASASSGMIDDKWAAYTSFSRLYSDGYRRNTFTDAYSFFLSVGYFGEKDFFKINAFDANSKNGLGYAAVLKSDLEADPRTNYLNENDEDDFGQQLVQLQHTHAFSNLLSITSSLYYGGAGGDFLFTYPISDSTFSQINYPLENKHYGFMSNTFWNPSESLEVSGGVHAYIFKRENQEALAPNFANPYYEENSDKKEVSAYAKANLDVNKWSFYADFQLRSLRLSIQPDYEFIGISEEGDIQKHWTFINPKVGVNFKIDNNLTAYASFGRTGRGPTKLDIIGGFQLNASNLELARSDAFKPEYVNDFEGGVRYANQNISFNANYFFMDFENEIAPIGEVIAFGVQRRSNIEDSYRTGLEVEGTYKPISILTFSGNITYMQSEITELINDAIGETYTNVSPILSPEWVYSASASVMPYDNLELTLNGRGISKSYLEISNDESLTLPGYFVSNFRANYKLAFIELAFEINNIQDENYYTSGSPVDVDFDGVIDGPGYFINAGRNYFLTTRITF